MRRKFAILQQGFWDFAALLMSVVLFSELETFDPEGKPYYFKIFQSLMRVLAELAAGFIRKIWIKLVPRAAPTPETPNKESVPAPVPEC